MKNEDASSKTTANVSTLFAQAVARHHAGALADAERFYQQILVVDERHVGALNNLGALHLQTGRLQEGILLIRRSLGINPNQPQACNNLGTAFESLKRLDEALASYDGAIALKSDFAEAHNNRGNVLQDLKRFDEALASYDRALELKPDYAEAQNNRGNVLRNLGRLDQALASYDRALVLRPDFAAAHNNRGNTLKDLKRLEEALASYDRALALRPNYAEAHSNRGNILHKLKRLEEAVTSFDRALALKPDFVEAHYNRANALQDLYRLEEALASYDRALALNPNLVEAHFNRANALQDLYRLEEALANYDRALDLNPNHVDAHYNRANALKELRRVEESIASYDRGLALRPDFAEAHYNRGNVLQDLGYLDEAVASYDRALALKPNFAEAYNNRGYALHRLKRNDEALTDFEKVLAIKPDLPYAFGSWLHSKMLGCDWEGFDAACAKITKAVERGEKVASPFPLLAISSSLAQQQRCAWTYVQDRYPASSTPLWQGERDTTGRIRVGYFSADFREHPISHLIAHLIELHDRRKFEVIGFAFGPSTNDSWRMRLANAFDRFFDVSPRTDREIATLARDLEIDIAIDLGGHTENSRTGVLALRPAPIQVNYLGYPGTIGADYIDYLIADHTLVAEEQRPYYNEKIAYLPHSFQVNDATKVISDRSFRRTELGLPDDAFVFCCFNNHYKITPDLFDIWMRILYRVEGSVFWLPEGNATAINNLRLEARRRGVSPDRLVFAPRMENLSDHLARLRQADLFLDTFYYNAHTTTSDALWAGLPVLTCLGDTFAGRVAASLLNAIGLPELITHNHAEYEALAHKLATQPDRLAAIRRKLAANRTTLPLFNTKRFARNIETAYMMMHERHQAGLPPDHIVVTEDAAGTDG